MNDKKFLVSIIFATLLAVLGFLIWFISNYSSHSILATKYCNDIFISKAQNYFPEGKNRYIFSKKMNTCLLLNTNTTSDNTGIIDDHVVVVDMITDDVIFIWEVRNGDTVDRDLGLTHDEAIAHVRTLGFLIL